MNIVVLAGGTSTERDVSLTTGRLVSASLKSLGHNVCFLDVFLGYDGSMNDIGSLFTNNTDDETCGTIGTVDPDIEKIKAQRGGDCLIGNNVIEICRFADIVFMALHGENGEDGKLQATFDLFGIKYTGSGCLGSAIAMNKYISKQIFIANNIPSPEYIYITKDNRSSLESVSFPCVVKPCSGGSSIGVTIVNDESELDKAIESGFKYENEIMIEKYIKGREFSIGILNGTALPSIEIKPKCGFYDYVNKYQAGMTEEICPAEISAETEGRIAEYAIKAYNALHLNVYARIDFLMDDNGDLYCLEANTLPGMTPNSLMPQEAAAVGISYAQLCEKIIEVSFDKYNP